MARMRAIRSWKGAEGRVRPGDEIEVTEDRARELEGYVRRTGRVLYPTPTADQGYSRERRVAPRAVRLDNAEEGAMYEDKGGPTAAERGGHAVSGETQSRALPDASPAAWRIAEEVGIDLDQVRGTGKGGRIIESDVRRARRETNR
jgi:pyruvate dehydrogenase E2 component (dihydrolipoamide acetyltransferase)